MLKTNRKVVEIMTILEYSKNQRFSRSRYFLSHGVLNTIAKHRKSVILTRPPWTGISWTYSDAEPRLSFFLTTYLLNIPFNPTNDPSRPQGSNKKGTFRNTQALIHCGRA